MFTKSLITLNIPLDAIKDFDTSNLKASWITEVEENIGCIVQKGEEVYIVQRIKETIMSCNPEYLRKYRSKIVENYGEAGKAVALYLQSSAKTVDGGNN